MFGRGLEFDQLAAGGHDEVHVDVGAGVFFVVEVEQDFSFDDADADRADKILERDRGQGSSVHQLFESQAERHEGARDGGGAGAAVGLDDVAVEPDRALAQAAQVGDGAQGAADEALDFVGAAAGASFADLARGSRQCGTGKHAVFAGDPTFAAVAQELRDGFFDRGGADYAGIADFDEGGAFGGVDVVGRDENGTELVGGTVVGAEKHRAGL